jgi:PPOX class probable F420-dependent enzyme
MLLDIDHSVRNFIIGHRVAHLATADREGRPSVVPICYAFDGCFIYSAIDEKPKKAAAQALKRVRNIAANPEVALIIDDYSEDWSKLAYVLIRGAAEVIDPTSSEHAQAVTLLREKYPQYRSMAIDHKPIIKITPKRVKYWNAL